MKVFTRMAYLRRGSKGGWVGDDPRLGGFFIVTDDSIIPEDLPGDAILEGEIVRTIIDKRGKPVPIVHLRPHVHQFQPTAAGLHSCECGKTEPHSATCPDRVCVCGVEVANPTHRYERLVGEVLRPSSDGKYLEEEKVWECVGCEKRTVYPGLVIPNPFYPDRVFTSYPELHAAIMAAEEEVESDPTCIPLPPHQPQLETTHPATIMLAWNRWKIDIENWFSSLPTEIKVGLAALLVEKKPSEGIAWARAVGEAIFHPNLYDFYQLALKLLKDKGVEIPPLIWRERLRPKFEGYRDELEITGYEKEYEPQFTAEVGTWTEGYSWEPVLNRLSAYFNLSEWAEEGIQEAREALETIKNLVGEKVRQVTSIDPLGNERTFFYVLKEDWDEIKRKSNEIYRRVSEIIKGEQNKQAYREG
jgi:hypothetical protein